MRLEHVQEAAHPPVHVVLLHPGPQGAHARAPLLLRHLQRGLQRIRHPIHVVGIHHQGIPQLVRRAGEFAEHQHPILVRPRGAELLGHQVHPIADGRDEHHVRGAVEGGELLLVEGAVEVVHGDVVDAAIEAVDAAHQLVHPLPVGGVVLHAGAAGDGHLDEAQPRPARRARAPAAAAPRAAAGEFPWCSPAGPRPAPAAAPRSSPGARAPPRAPPARWPGSRRPARRCPWGRRPAARRAPRSRRGPPPSPAPAAA